MTCRNSIAVGSFALLTIAPMACQDGGLGAAAEERAGTGARGGLEGHFVAEGQLDTECGYAAGIRLEVEDPTGETTVCDAEWAATLGGEGGSPVADCFFVGPSGPWWIHGLDALDEHGDALTCCESEIQEVASVHPSETTEIGGRLHCSTTESGGLDVFAVLETPPVIVDVDILPSKFGTVCVPIELVVTATGEGTLTYGWEVLVAPEGATWSLEGEGSTVEFLSATLGDYEIRVTVIDESGASASLDFPIHIIGQGDATCEPGEDEPPPPDDEPPPPDDEPPPEGDDCTRTQGYWKNHPESWPVDELKLGKRTYDQDELLQIFHTPPEGDATLILAHQLIAAKLNVASGATAPDRLIERADAWLSEHPIGSDPEGEARVEGIAIARRLTEFNEGGPGDCEPDGSP